jgi:hypothetical protein
MKDIKMITQLITLSVVVILIRLVWQTAIYKKLGFKEIPDGFEVGVVCSILALILIGMFDFVGVLSIFSYEIYLKIKGLTQ